MKTYYITGIAGFVGRNILLLLEKEKDINIVGFVLEKEKDLSFFKEDNISLVVGNITNYDDVYKFLSFPSKGEKYIIHVAGRVTTLKNHDPLTMDINFNGTKNIVDASNSIGGFKKMVYVSSVDSLPRRKDKEEIKEVETYDISQVEGIYSKSKVLANNYILENASTHTSIVLPSAILGPNDPNRAPINNAIRKFIRHELPAVTRGGYNLVDVRDVSSGILLALEKGKDKESYLITGEYISVKDLIGNVANLVNRKPIKLVVPSFIIYMVSPFIELYAAFRHKIPLFTGFAISCLTQNSRYTYQKAKKELGYKARNINETLKDTIKWMNESDYLK